MHIVHMKFLSLVRDLHKLSLLYNDHSGVGEF